MPAVDDPVVTVHNGKAHVNERIGIVWVLGQPRSRFFEVLGSGEQLNELRIGVVFVGSPAFPKLTCFLEFSLLDEQTAEFEPAGHMLRIGIHSFSENLFGVLLAFRPKEYVAKNIVRLSQSWFEPDCGLQRTNRFGATLFIVLGQVTKHDESVGETRIDLGCFPSGCDSFFISVAESVGLRFCEIDLLHVQLQANRSGKSFRSTFEFSLALMNQAMRVSGVILVVRI